MTTLVAKTVPQPTAPSCKRRLNVLGADGRIRRRQLEDQENQASCLNLVTNAIITWNTVYIAEVLRRLRAEGHQVNDDAIAHLSPAMYAHVNKHGKYRFDVDRLQAGQLRPLRQPTVGTP